MENVVKRNGRGGGGENKDREEKEDERVIKRSEDGGVE